MEISTKSIANFELILKFPEEMKPKFGSDISLEEGNTLLKIAYQPTMQKLVNFLSYAIGSNDFDSIVILEDTMLNIAKSKIENR